MPRRYGILIGLLATLTLLPISACAQDRSAPISRALLAQVQGFGDCGEVINQRSIVSSFFPEVRIMEESCLTKHGDSVVALVAEDASGIFYSLDSELAFNFLVQMHPPRGIESTNSIEFARTALMMMGLISPTDSLITDPHTLNDEQLLPYRLKRSQVIGTRIKQTEEGYEASISVLGHQRVRQHEIVVNRTTGVSHVTASQEWIRH